MQIIWARELGFGITLPLRKLPPHSQTEVRSGIPKPGSAKSAKSEGETSITSSQSRAIDPIGNSIDLLIVDDELRNRCKDLLRSRTRQDRVFREATVVLEDRIRRISGITERMHPAALVSRAINPDLAKTILIYSSEAGEQQGFHNVCHGIVLTFRDRAHHGIDDKVQREEAFKFCLFIDLLLSMLGSCKKRT
jgi:hypothetical protein